MRVEAAPYVFRNEDRRQRFEGRRASDEELRPEQPQSAQRAKHAAHVWFHPALGAHILGQVKPTRATAAEARRAYQQPEARTPLRPSLITSA